MFKCYKCIFKKKLIIRNLRKRTEKNNNCQSLRIKIIKDKIKKKIKKIATHSGYEIKKNQNYGSNDEIKNKLKFNKKNKE